MSRSIQDDLVVTGIIYGSLAGNSGTSTSASFASTASFAPNYVLTSATSSMLSPYVLTSSTSSFAITGSNRFTGDQIITGSLTVSSSNAAQFTKQPNRPHGRIH